MTRTLSMSTYTSFADLRDDGSEQSEPDADETPEPPPEPAPPDVDEDPWQALHACWVGAVQHHLADAIFTATGINEYNERIIAYLEPRAVHPLDMMYLHSHVGDKPQSVREKEGVPLLARMSNKFETVATPESLQEELTDHLGHGELDEMSWIKAVMAFVALRLFNYTKDRHKAPAPPRAKTALPTTPAVLASLDYSRFDSIADSDDE